MLFYEYVDLLNGKSRIKFKIESETSSIKIEDCCKLQYDKVFVNENQVNKINEIIKELNIKKKIFCFNEWNYFDTPKIELQNIKSGLFRIKDEGDIIVIQYYDKEGKPICN